MQLRQFLCFHSGTNNITFLLLYEARLLGKWLQTFRQTVRVSFSKEQTSKTIPPTVDIRNIFQREVQKTKADKSLTAILEGRTPFGGNMHKWDDSINMDLKAV